MTATWGLMAEVCAICGAGQEYGCVMEPTPLPDLNGVLAELVRGVRDGLRDNFCGAYLHGSFAIGDADVWSDVDFIVVIEAEVDESQLASLQRLHRRLYALEVPWAQH